MYQYESMYFVYPTIRLAVCLFAFLPVHLLTFIPCMLICIYVGVLYMGMSNCYFAKYLDSRSFSIEQMCTDVDGVYRSCHLTVMCTTLPRGRVGLYLGKMLNHGYVKT